MRFYLSILLFALSVVAFGQKEKKNIRKGNKHFLKNKFDKSSIEYLKALEKNPNSFKAKFNMGDVLYKQKKYDQANSTFVGLAQELEAEKKEIKKKEKLTKADYRKLEEIKTKLSSVYHNMGNTFMNQKKLDESIKSYISSLKNNPKDEETRYNLAYALKQRQQQQQQQKKQNKDQKKKDKQDQKKKQEQKKQKEQDEKEKKDKQNKNQQQQQQQQKRNKISKEDAKRMLKALQQDEKKLQEKLKKKKAKNVQMYIEKNW